MAQTTTTTSAHNAVLIRRAADRGPTNLGWLDSRHTFSFGRYHDHEWMGFGPLRVINDDRVAPGAGFGAHPHRDMEIISYVVDGQLEHKDSAGHGSVIGAGGVQVMSAGTGIEHAEFNPSADRPVRFLQIWIEPDSAGHTPRHDSRVYERMPNTPRLLVSGDGRDGSLAIHRDADIAVLTLDASGQVELPHRAGRRVWVQVVTGEVTASVDGVADDIALAEGDGLGLEPAVADAEKGIVLRGHGEVLVFSIAD